jgi:hypothetical protein
VLRLLGRYEPDILASATHSVAGPEYFLPAGGFLGDMRWTASIALDYQSFEWTSGWTASSSARVPVAGSVSTSFPPVTGSFAVGPTGSLTEARSDRGIWLWRSAAGDHTPPSIAPSVTGTLGDNGWHVSDVTVGWDVEDAESAISSRVGCETATVAADTPGTTFSCAATSAGGTSSSSILVKRDTVAPTVTCGPQPVFEINQPGASVSATVTDATSGAAGSIATAPAATGTAGTFTAAVTGRDLAGNAATAQCSYRVVVPTCHGLVPTRVGTAFNDVIEGTSGSDVIVALGGADTVNGNGGDDVICGGDGPDTIDGGDGNDWLDGGAGNDSLRGGAGTDTCTSGEVRMSSCEL